MTTDAIAIIRAQYYAPDADAYIPAPGTHQAIVRKDGGIIDLALDHLTIVAAKAANVRNVAGDDHD